MSEPSASPSARWQKSISWLRARVRRGGAFVAGIAATLIALLIYGQLVPAPTPLSTDDVNAAINNAMASATPAPAYSSIVYQIIMPSFVLIQTSGSGSNHDSSGVGSGVIINDAGDILTSLHVVEQASEITLTFSDGTQSPAQITAAQPENDIAVLQALQPPAQIVPATLGNPNAMQIGDEAYVVGNPLGIYGSMSSGIVSGLNRTFQPKDGGQTLEGLIQIDAAVNPGNSGGPLLNRYGQVVGIVTGLVNPTEQNVFIGLGFAVPITTAGSAAGLPPY